MTRRIRVEKRHTAARILTAVVVVALVQSSAIIVGASDLRPRTTISPQPFRHPVDFGTDKKVRIDGMWSPRADKSEISVLQNHALDFGTLCLRTGSLLVGIDGSVQDNSDQLYYGGSTQAAEFIISGDALHVINIDFSANPVNGFLLDDFITNLGAPPLNTVLDEAGNLIIQVGARLFLDSAEARTGSGQTVGYTLSAYYE